MTISNILNNFSVVLGRHAFIWNAQSFVQKGFIYIKSQNNYKLKQYRTKQLHYKTDSSYWEDLTESIYFVNNHNTHPQIAMLTSPDGNNQ